jgi:cytochrome c biogenesis protein CcdA
MHSIEIGSAFFEGFFMVLSPCIISILPIVLSTSFDGNKLRPLGVIIGLILSFSIFTLSLGKLVDSIGLSQQAIRLFASLAIALFALSMIFSSLLEIAKNKFAGNMNSNLISDFSAGLVRFGNSLIQRVNETKFSGDFLGGLLVGACLGLIWTPCIGPIVGLAVSQAVSQANIANSLMIVISFSCGVAFPMLLVAVYGKSLINKVSFFKNHHILVRQVFASIILCSVILNSGKSIAYADTWVKANVLGDQKAEIQLKDMDSSGTPKIGCSIDS